MGYHTFTGQKEDAFEIHSFYAHHSRLFYFTPDLIIFQANHKSRAKKGHRRIVMSISSHFYYHLFKSAQRRAPAVKDVTKILNYKEEDNLVS